MTAREHPKTEHTQTYHTAGTIRYDRPKKVHHLTCAILIIFLTPILCAFALFSGFFIGVPFIFCILSLSALLLIYKAIRLKNKTIASISVLALPLLTFAIGYHIWNSGSPYGDREYDETGQYYVQRYSTIGPSTFRMSMPGNGSDNIDGFIRLYDSKGNLMNEYFTTYLVGIEPTWLDDSLWLMGTSNEITWPLP